MTDRQGFDCFLSHNSRDKAAVSVWLDEEQLRPGVTWQPLLESGIRASRSVAVLVGKDGLGPWEQKEMRAALAMAMAAGSGLPVIPVLLPDAPAKPELPIFLTDHTWVDLRPGAGQDPRAAIDRLVWGITGRRPEGAQGQIEPFTLDTITAVVSQPAAQV